MDQQQPDDITAALTAFLLQQPPGERAEQLTTALSGALDELGVAPGPAREAALRKLRDAVATLDL